MREWAELTSNKNKNLFQSIYAIAISNTSSLTVPANSAKTLNICYYGQGKIIGVVSYETAGTNTDMLSGRVLAYQSGDASVLHFTFGNPTSSDVTITSISCTAIAVKESAYTG